MNLKFVKIAFLFLTLVLIVWLFVVNARPLEKYREKNEFAKVPITVDICLDKGADTKRTARILDDIWQLNRDIYSRMSNDFTDSDIAKINRSFKNPQKISEDTIKVLNAAIKYKKITNGSFDVSVRSLTELWSKCERENRLPTQEELAKAKAVMRLSQIKFLLGNRVELLNPQMRIDFNGIVSGYALDATVRMLHKKGVRNFLIDAGGDMYASGRNCSRKPWTIAVRNPDDRSKILDVVMVSDLAVATSGGFEKYYAIGGRKFSHIINPTTGWPQKAVVSATVIAPKAMDNNVLAEALCVLGPKEGIRLIDSMGRGYASLVVTKDAAGRLMMHKSKLYTKYEMHKP